MKLMTTTLALVALGGLVPTAAHAHGGQYRGPGDTVPPGGGGDSGSGRPPGPTPPSPGTGNPGSPTGTPGVPVPGQPKGSASVPLSGGPGMPDLTQWGFWWEFNKEPYLELKSHVWDAPTTSGSGNFWLGKGQQDARDSQRPDQAQIRSEVVPALLRALENETSNDIVTGCLVALAKIGDANREDGTSEFAGVIARFLAAPQQEVSETAAIALGILGNPSSIDDLRELLCDSSRGRELVARHEVPYRTRAFAAYGLGQIGAGAVLEKDRRRVVRILHEALESDETKTRDVQVACVVSLGLVPLELAGAPDDAPLVPEHGREAELAYLLALLGDQGRHHLVRAHCPTALARLLRGLAPAQRRTLRVPVAHALLERMDPRVRERDEVVQSSVLALGLIGSNDGGDELDRAVRDGLARVLRESGDQQTRRFALIALGKVGGNPGSADPADGIDFARGLLLQRVDEKGGERSWAALGLGVLGHALRAHDPSADIEAMTSAVRGELEREKNADRLGALAIASGLLRDVEAQELLLKALERERDDVARGYVALGLGLIGERTALEPIQAVVETSKYRPELIRQAAIALGLLGDSELVPRLTAMLEDSRALSSQAALASALGFIGDRRSIAPLVRMLANEELSDAARGFAAVALGIVADREPLPWNAAIATDLNYRASTGTLTDPSSGTGILDLL